MSNPELLSIQDAAARLGISPKTAYKHASDGLIRTVMVGGSRKVPEAEVQRIVREGTRPMEVSA